MEKIEILSKKPLVEAIFELRWELKSIQQQGPVLDPLYDVMVGTMRTKLQEKFPQHVRLPAAQVPGMMMPWAVQHQFRSSEGWPLVQLGSGILTVNETETYTSKNFLATCLSVFGLLQEFWRENESNPKIVNCQLRYVDAEILGEKSIEDLLSQLDVTMQYGKRIQRSEKLTKDFDAFQLATRMKCLQPIGFAALNFNRGLKEGKDALIWETAISTEGQEASHFSASPEKWLREAHEVSHELFFSMIEGNLLERYK